MPPLNDHDGWSIISQSSVAIHGFTSFATPIAGNARVADKTNRLHRKHSTEPFNRDSASLLPFPTNSTPRGSGLATSSCRRQKHPMSILKEEPLTAI